MIPLNENKQKFLELMDKYTNQDVIIAFSGGVDSSLILKTACKQSSRKNHKVYAFTIHTTLHPMYELELTERIAKEEGAIYEVIRVDELQNAGIMDNPVNRCYLCKKHLFTKLREMARKLQIEVIMDGTNEDDLHVYRPGIKALKELQIISPLAEAGMTKADVREMAKEVGLSVSNRPSAPCLATRFPYGTELSYEEMRKVEKGEEYIKSLGFYNVRIRVHADIARIEVDCADLNKLVEHSKNIVAYLKELGYPYVTVDLEGFRSGSMDYKRIQDQRDDANR
jgi:uncharacterized protein